MQIAILIAGIFFHSLSYGGENPFFKTLRIAHDWRRSFTRAFGFTTEETPTPENFQGLVEQGSDSENCNLDGLALWTQEHPRTITVTDTTGNNVKPLSSIGKKSPNAKTRVIPQNYQPEHSDIAKRLDSEAINWTFYRYKGLNEDMLWRVVTFCRAACH